MLAVVAPVRIWSAAVAAPTFKRPSRHIGRLAVVTALAVLTAGGCGGGTKTNGLERKSAAQVERAAAAALKGARSVHVVGTSRSQGKLQRIDLRIQGASSSGTIETGGAAFAIIRVGADTYIKADQRAWQALGVPPSLQRLASGRWVKLRSQQATSFEGMSLDSLAAELATSETPLQHGVQQATLGGDKVVVLSQQDGSKLYVANTGPPYPLRAERKGNDSGHIDFTEYGTDFHITAPSNVLDLSSNG